MIHRTTKPSYAVMTNLYDTIRELFKDDKLYYTSKELEELKKDDSKIFITKDNQT